MSNYQIKKKTGLDIIEMYNWPKLLFRRILLLQYS